MRQYIYIIWEKIYFEKDKGVGICEEISAFSNIILYEIIFSQHDDKTLKLRYYLKFFFVSLCYKIIF